MNLEELKAQLKPLLKEDVVQDENTWSTIEKGIDEVVNNNTLGVIENKNKLLEEKKTIQAKFEEYRNKFGKFEEAEVDFDAFNKMKSELEYLKSSSENVNADLKTAREQAYEQGRKALEAEISPKLKELETNWKSEQEARSQLFTKYLEGKKQNLIDSTLEKLNIKADPFWKRGFMQEAEMEYDDVRDVVSINVPNPLDPSSKIPLKDWGTIFVTTEAGKKMIPAPANTGAGALGSDGKPIREDLKSTLENMFK